MPNAFVGDDKEYRRGGTYESVQVYLAGRCRIDPRWHDARAYSKLYGTHPLLAHLDGSVERSAVEAYFGVTYSSSGGGGRRTEGTERGGGGEMGGDGGVEKSGRAGVNVLVGEHAETVCFWCTNVVDLLCLEDRAAVGGASGSSVVRVNGTVRPLALGMGKELEVAAAAGRGDRLKSMLTGTSHSVAVATVAEGGAFANGGTDLDGTSPVEECKVETDSIDGERQRVRRRQHSEEEDEQNAMPPFAFTFRADIPDDVPPTANTACCRYFYSAVVCAKMKSGKVFVIQAPFTVLSGVGRSGTQNRAAEPAADTKAARTAGRVKVGTLVAVAHPFSLPCHITSTELDRPSQLSVDRNASGLCSTGTLSDVRSMRVADENGSPCCVLTIVGSTVVRPGSQILLQFDFDEESLLVGGAASESDGGGGGGSSILPCHRVCASIEGEEVAIYDNGSRKRTRSYVFDAKSECVDPGFVDSLPLTLSLPLDCPCTLRTDLVEVAMRCKVELMVDRPGGKGYNALRLEIPCNVHGVVEDDDSNGAANGGGQNGLPRCADMDLLVWGSGGSDGDETGKHNGFSSRFVAKDIMKDLKMLSMHMMDGCG